MKKVFFTLLFIICCYSVFSLDAERVDAPFDFKLGNDVTEIIANLGEPKVINSFDDNETKRTFMFYDNIRIGLWHIREDEKPLMFVIISSPSLTVFNGIHVGMDVNEAKKILGEPMDSNDIAIYYDGITHYITFFVDRFNQITSINWTYYID